MSKYTITHTCGHQSTQNIVGPEAGRGRKAEWFRARVCPSCYGAERRAEEAAAFARNCGWLPPELRTRHYTGPGAALAVKEAAE